jgi:hypothetical protein
MKARFQLTRRLRRFAGRERGTQMVELAIVLPIFVLLFAATAEFGRFFYTYTTLSKATRVGARYLMSQPALLMDEQAKNLVVCGKLTACTNDAAVVSGLDVGQVRIYRAGGAPGFPATINVRIENFYYEPIFDLGKLTGNPALSLKIQLMPSTMMQALSTTPVIL